MLRVRTTFVVFVMLCCSPLFAITDQELFRNFQFSFVNPGARASAMGNAFIALADDATAAEANPAGLTILTKPEVSFEYRNVSYDENTLNSFNDVQASVTSLFIESNNNLETLNQVSFFSFVYPKGKHVLAFSRQEAVRIRGTIDELLHIFPSGVGADEVLVEALAVVEQDVINWNLSYAYKLSSDLSVGASARISRLDWITAEDTSLEFLGFPFGAFETTVDDSDTALAWNAGAIYRAGKYVSLGAVYKKNAEFSATGFQAGETAKKPGPFENVFKVPDVWGAGVAVRVTDSLIVTSDLVRIEYSDLLEGFLAGYNFLTETADNSDVTYSIDDVFEFRIGAEFFLMIKDIPVAIRQGYYRKPSNALVLASAAGLSEFTETVVSSVFVETDDENHVTIGNGFVISNFQVDWALDLSKSVTNFVLSTVFRF